MFEQFIDTQLIGHTTEDSRYTFFKGDEVIDYTELKVGDVFFAKDTDGNLIEDDDGNTVFEVAGPVSDNISGAYVPCTPIRRV